MPTKPVGETKAILVMGPYKDKRVPNKWMMRVIDNTSGVDRFVNIFGTDTHPLHVALRRCFKKRLNAKQQP